MRTKVVRIGNSRGVRIPKPLLEQAGLEGDVELEVVESSIIIRAVDPGVDAPRAGWEQAAAEIADRGEGELLDEPAATEFDETEWVW